MKYLIMLFKVLLFVVVIGAMTYVGPADAKKNWRVFAGAWSYHFLQDDESEVFYKQQYVTEFIYNDYYDLWVPVEVLRDIRVERRPFEFNSRHDLLAVEYNRFIFGYFKNSFYDHAALAGYKIYFKELGPKFRFDLYAGVSYGYRDCITKYDDSVLFNDYSNKSRKVCPIAVPMITYTGSSIQPYVSLFGTALTIGLSRSF